MEFGSPEQLLRLKKYIISLIVQEAQADQDFSIAEKKYLAYVGRTLELSVAEVAAIRLNPQGFEISPPPGEHERMNVLYYLLFMMRADKTIKKEEEELCHHVGFRLGFRREMIADMIAVMRDCLDKEIPPTALMERVKVYLN